MADATVSGRSSPAGGASLGRPFATLWMGQSVSLLGDQITLIALPLLAVTYCSASSFDVGVLAACLRLPFLLVGLPAGIWVARAGLIRSMTAADLVRGTAMAAAVAVAVTGFGGMPLLCGLAIAAGTATVFFQVAYQSVVPTLIHDADRWHIANSRLTLAESLSLLIGPAVGGVVVASAAPPGALLIDSATYSVSVTALLMLAHYTRAPKHEREPGVDAAPRLRLWPEIVDGWRYVRKQPLLNAIMWTGAAYNLGSAMYDAIIVIFAIHTLHLSPAEFGLAIGVGGIGFPIGSLISGAVTRRLGLGPALLWAAVPSVAGLFVTAFATDPRPQIFLVAGTFLVGLGQGCFAVNAITIRHLASAPAFRSRATSVHRFTSWGMLPVGALLAGAVSSLVSVRAAMITAGLTATLCAWPLLRSSLRAARGTDDIAREALATTT